MKHDWISAGRLNKVHTGDWMSQTYHSGKEIEIDADAREDVALKIVAAYAEKRDGGRGHPRGDSEGGVYIKNLFGKAPRNLAFRERRGYAIVNGNLSESVPLFSKAKSRASLDAWTTCGNIAGTVLTDAPEIALEALGRSARSGHADVRVRSSLGRKMRAETNRPAALCTNSGAEPVPNAAKGGC